MCKQSHHRLVDAPFQSQDVVTVCNSNVIYVNRKSAGNTGMAPRAGDRGFSLLYSKAKSSQWIPSVCLTLHAFNHVTSMSASSHTELNMEADIKITIYLVRVNLELRLINRALVRHYPASKNTKKKKIYQSLHYIPLIMWSKTHINRGTKWNFLSFSMQIFIDFFEST